MNITDIMNIKLHRAFDGHGKMAIHLLREWLQPRGKNRRVAQQSVVVNILVAQAHAGSCS